MSKPVVNNCAKCVRIARGKTWPRPAATAVSSPSGKAHWMVADGYTFCGVFGRNWPDAILRLPTEIRHLASAREAAS